MWPTSKLLLIQPKYFRFNGETAQSNQFQNQSHEAAGSVAKEARKEFEAVQGLLDKNEITYLTFSGLGLPDEVFPNNWLMVDHRSRSIHLFPMLASNRRNERRPDITEGLLKLYPEYCVQDWSSYEKQSEYCEGTGSLVLQRNKKLAFACLSSRTSPRLCKEITDFLGYELFAFKANTDSFSEIYHTNVILACGLETAIICKEAVCSEQRETLMSVLNLQFKTVIEITVDQVRQFCGNILLVKNCKDEAFWLMSDSARAGFTSHQISALETEARILSTGIPHIESIGGGSLRCMLAEI